MYEKPVLTRFGTFRELTKMTWVADQLPGGCRNPVPGLMNPNCGGSAASRIS